MLPNPKCQIGKGFDEGLTETHAGKINDRRIQLGVGPKGRRGEKRTLAGLPHLWNRSIDSEDPDALFNRTGKCDGGCGVVFRIVR